MIDNTQLQDNVLIILMFSLNEYLTEPRSHIKNTRTNELNPLIPGGNKKVTHTSTNLQLNAERSAAGLFKYV